MNELTTVNQNQNAVEIVGLFKDINFNELNTVIQALGDKSSELTPDEKVAATNIISSWNKNVVGRIRTHLNDMENMLRLFSTNVGTHSHEQFLTQTVLNDQQLIQLIAVTATTDLYETFLKAHQDQIQYVEANEPQRPFVDKNMSALEIAKAESQYQLDYVKYEIELTKRKRKVVMAFREFIKTVTATTQVKAMVAKAKLFVKDANTLYSECDVKTNMAKLNIQISSGNIRDSLRDLMSFASQI